MEKQDFSAPKTEEVLQERRKTPHVLQAGNMNGFLERRLGDLMDQHSGGGSLVQWEAQWQEFLRTLENPQFGWGIPPLPEKPSPWEDAKAFLASFEQVAEACRWPKEEWGIRLLPALSGEAVKAFNSLDARDREDYGKVPLEEAGRALSKSEWRQLPMDIKEEEDGEAILRDHIQENTGDMGQHSWLLEKSKDGETEGSFRNQVEPQNQVKNDTVESSDKPIPCQEEEFLEIENQKEKPTQHCQNQGLSAHERIHIKEKLNGSVEFGQSISQSMDIVSHEEIHLREKQYNCAECGKSFSRKTALISHLRIHSGDDQEDEEDEELHQLSPDKVKNEEFKGNFRNRGGPKTQEESRAVEKMDDSIPFQGGDFCGIIHVWTEPYKCSMCEMNFLNQTQYNIHMQMHSGKMPHECSECGKSFLHRTEFLRHQRIHTGEKLHKCLECGKFFRQRGKLVIHQRMHTGEKPHKCSESSKGFSSLSNLIRSKISKSKEKPHKCFECGKDFCSLSNLTRHEIIHSEEKPYKCLECGKSFIRRAHLEQHQRSHTGEKPFECSECGRRFLQKAHLFRHQRVHTRKNLTSAQSGTRPPPVFHTLTTTTESSHG